MDILLIVIVAIMVGTIAWFRKIRHQQVNAIASIVTVIGVLGTFLGIAIGLYQFDTENIEASVPALLEGLKVAFVSSIVGIIGSIVLKWLALNRQRKQASSKKPTDATVDDLVETLKAIYEAQQSEGHETRETLRAIEKALTGDGDSTVLTQLQKLRTTFSDKQDDLIDAFKDFATQMAENNTQALIQALEEVMRDFNAKINEQFGDNFKQLNEAVGRINDWQEQYRQQMDELAAEFRIAADSIERSRQSLEIIAERSDAIVSSAEKLDPILRAIQDQIQEMNARLEAFSALADNARNAFPIIEDRLNQLTDDFSQVVEGTIANSHASMENQREALQDFTEQIEAVIQSVSQGLERTVAETNRGLEELTDDFSQVVEGTIANSHASMENQREALQDFTEQIEAVIQSVSQGLERTVAETNRGLEDTLQNQSTQLKSIVEETNRQIRTEIEAVIQSISQGLERTVAETNRGLEDTLQNQSTQLKSIVEATNLQIRTEIERVFRELDNALERELTKAIESLGSQLTSLSRQFVQDYTPLTDQLRNVVRIAERLQTGR